MSADGVLRPRDPSACVLCWSPAARASSAATWRTGWRARATTWWSTTHWPAPGVEQNLEWLQRRHPHRISAVVADVRDASSLDAVAHDASAVFHLAAQVAVTTSLVEPVADFDVNVRATLSLLESVRAAGTNAPVIFASTNKVYGDLADLEMVLEDGGYAPRDPKVRRYGVGEDRPLDFHTPYGCSKGAADQYVLDYARSFGPADSGAADELHLRPPPDGDRGPGMGRPLPDPCAGGPGHQHLRRRPPGARHPPRRLTSVDAYMAAWRGVSEGARGRVSGRAFNLGGGPANAVSLRQLLAHIEALIGREVKLDFSDWRAGDQRYFVADARRAHAELGLPAAKGWRDGVAELAAWLAQARGFSLSQRVAEAAQ